MDNKKSDGRDKTPRKITIKIPTYVYLALQADAEANRRTMARQLETILVDHFKLDQIETK